MITMECEFCKNTFKSDFNLTTHQRSAKYCLKIQNEINTSLDVIYKCEFCDILRTSRTNLDLHRIKCKLNIPAMHKKIKMVKDLDELRVKFERELADKDVRFEHMKNYYINIIADVNQQLTIVTEQYKNSLTENDKQLNALTIYKNLAKRNQDTLSDIAKQPRNNTNNTNTSQTNILMAMTPLDINESVFGDKINEYFTTDYLVSGQKGVAQFCVDHLLKDEHGKLTYVCTDPSRNTFRYRTVNGVLERDVNAKKLTNALSQNLKKHAANEMIKISSSGDYDKLTAYTPGSLCITCLDDNNSDFCSGLKSIVTSS